MSCSSRGINVATNTMEGQGDYRSSSKWSYCVSTVHNGGHKKYFSGSGGEAYSTTSPPSSNGLGRTDSRKQAAAEKSLLKVMYFNCWTQS
ncbi:hypothetical protein TIFTF001_020080 [Ficus carica]|uniref:Uncharacterized protein n=1 Tax=Ficus carica TaxID=3494 RepID=A0AA88A7W4_FICCA|nr:hypothetical protein TIFTF001_020080 [Ficus carica]